MYKQDARFNVISKTDLMYKYFLKQILHSLKIPLKQEC